MQDPKTKTTARAVDDVSGMTGSIGESSRDNCDNRRDARLLPNETLNPAPSFRRNSLSPRDSFAVQFTRAPSRYLLTATNIADR